MKVRRIPLLLEIRNVCLSILLLIFLVILLFTLLPVFIYRLCLIWFANKFRPDLLKIISGLSTAFLGVRPDGRLNIWANITVTFKIEGELNYKKFVDKFCKIILKKQDGSHLEYSTLQTYPVSWLGYSFWKWENNFNPLDHIQRDRIPKGTVCEYEKKFRQIPFEKEKSPWALMCVDEFSENENGNKEFYYIFKFNHILMDGHSALGILMKLADDSPLPYAKVEKKTNVLNHIFWDILIKPFRIAYALVKVQTALSEDRTVENCYPQQQGCDFIRYSVKGHSFVNFQKIKALSSSSGYPCVTILSYMTSKGIYQYLLKTKKKIPKYITYVFPILLPNPRPHGCGNHFYTTMMNLSMEAETDKNRLDKCHASILEGLDPMYLAGLHFISSTLRGSCPNWLRNIHVFIRIPTIAFSSFPGPRTQISICGQTVTDMYYEVEGGIGICMGITSLVYNGQFRWVVKSYSNVFRNHEDLEDFTNNLLEFKYTKAQNS